ncbi:hypothetical protein [Staphylococcus aureus]
MAFLLLHNYTDFIKKQATDYIGIDFEIEGYEKLKDYNVLLKFFGSVAK